LVLLRQISEAEKAVVPERHGPRCFIDGHPLELTEVEFDHVQPYAEGGVSEVGNIAAVCRKHNREKRTLSLSEYRDRLALKRFFDGVSKRRLDDLLEVKLGSHGWGHDLVTEAQNGAVTLYLDESDPQTLPIYKCPATGEAYFFASLPIRLLQNDVELQPRALEFERVWELYRHLRTHTQLAPAVCRYVGRSLLLFDGQHKAAAQVWAGRAQLDCKVYLEPDVRRLKETNLSAHDRLRQMPFYTSTLLEKYAAMTKEDWDEFLETSAAKNEATFVEFIRAKAILSRAEAVKRVRAKIYEDIIQAPGNLLRDYIAEENRGRTNPLTMSRLERTFFAEFVAPVPLVDEFESEAYHRDEERENLVRLFNLVVLEALADKWAPDRRDASHLKAERLFSAGALRAWVPFLKDAIAPGLGLYETQERSRIFYRELSEKQFEIIARLLSKLLSHKVWEDPSPDLKDLRYDDAERAKEMLRRFGLTPNWILGGQP